MKTSVPPVSALRRRSILAVTFTIAIVAAFAIALSFAASTGVLAFAPSAKDPTPFSATPIDSCVVQDPNGPGRVWVPHRSETAIPRP
jgi:hypothetical protein